jgi:hypothetical protein
LPSFFVWYDIDETRGELLGEEIDGSRFVREKSKKQSGAIGGLNSPVDCLSGRRAKRQLSASPPRQGKAISSTVATATA